MSLHLKHVNWVHCRSTNASTMVEAAIEIAPMRPYYWLIQHACPDCGLWRNAKLGTYAPDPPNNVPTVYCDNKCCEDYIKKMTPINRIFCKTEPYSVAPRTPSPSWRPVLRNDL